MLGSLLMNLVIPSHCFLLYIAFLHKGFDFKKSWWKFTIYVTIICSYMLLTKTIIDEPFRIIIMLLFGLILLSLLIERKRIANFLVLLMSYTISMILSFISILIVSIITYFINRLIDLNINGLIIIVVYYSIGLALYYKIKSKEVLSFLKATEIQALTYILCAMTLTFYFYTRIKEFSKFSKIDSLDTTVLIIFFAGIIISAIIFGIFQIIRYKERIHLENDRKELRAKAHRHKDTIPAIYTVIEKLKESGDPNAEKYVNLFSEVATELSGDLHYESIKENIKRLDMPEEWEVLESWLGKIATDYPNEGVNITIQNSADDEAWKQLNISQLEFVRLAGNLIGNAKKELLNTDNKLKHITVIFRNRNNVFEFDVQDTAHEFPIAILSKLGERGNSTNGTGDGYAEIFEFLEKHKASLTIFEVASGKRNVKRIKVAFDGKIKIAVHSKYRYEKLKKALKDTKIEVVSMGQ